MQKQEDSREIKEGRLMGRKAKKMMSLVCFLSPVFG